MELTPNLHAFIWTNPSANNCNTYLIRSPEKAILIDPGHAAYFDHVRQGLDRLGMTMADIDLVICTHAHPDQWDNMDMWRNDSEIKIVAQREFVDRIRYTDRLAGFFVSWRQDLGNHRKKR